MSFPLITEIQRFSLQDGPGIRTTIFIKGCPLFCPWCHNPETRNSKQEFYYQSAKCIQCGRCVQVCKKGANRETTNAQGKPDIAFDRNRCILCMSCVEECPVGAREVVGKSLSMDDIISEALADRPFFENSGGGVTISGGDPLFFPEFTLLLCKALKEEGIHIALETSCFVRWEIVESLLDYVDLFIVDLKTLDAEKYATIIGTPLSRVLENIENLLQHDSAVRIHIPIIPEFNNTKEDYQCFVNYLASFAEKLRGVDILPFHSYGSSKYTYLGLDPDYRYKNVRDLADIDVISLVDELKAVHVRKVSIGGLVGIGKKYKGRN